MNEARMDEGMRSGYQAGYGWGLNHPPPPTLTAAYIDQAAPRPPPKAATTDAWITYWRRWFLFGWLDAAADANPPPPPQRRTER